MPSAPHRVTLARPPASPLGDGRAGPPPLSPDERTRFDELQAQLARQFRTVFDDRLAPRTVVAVPSLTLDPEVLARVDGAHHYEERLLCLLMLLRLPRTRLVFVTSQPVASSIIDYYLHLLPGIPFEHARARLTLICCHDASARSLTQKILERPRLIRRIHAALDEHAPAHLTCFNATPLERQLALALDIPLYATDPRLAHLGTKSGSRAIFREAGVAMPDGEENLRDVQDVVEALTSLKQHHPALRRAVVKLNDGFSGEGNALFSFEEAPTGASLQPWIEHVLPRTLQFEAETMTWAAYRAKFEAMGGIAECFVEGAQKRSPSVQCRINPAGGVRAISTHDQVLGGPSGQIFLGCTFPADAGYRLAIQESGLRVAEVLRSHGALGRFGVDFVSVREGDAWRHYAIEINLRKGGTTHPYLMLQYLTDGAYDSETGLYRIPTGPPRYYVASDNLRSDAYRGLTPVDLIDIAVCHGLHFHGATQQGVVFHLIGALSEFGKLGVLCIGDSPAHARQLYDHTVEVLDDATRPV